MAITKTTENDKIEVVSKWNSEDADVKAICNAAWTSQVKTDFTAFLVANKAS